MGTGARAVAAPPLHTLVAEEDGVLLGSYFLKPNAAGPGGHVCNCGYMVAEAARGKGVARLMCEHSQRLALDSGFLAMQFNSVVASNEVAVALWRKLGYEQVGRPPRAYRHARLGLVDCLVMYKWLAGAGRHAGAGAVDRPQEYRGGGVAAPGRVNRLLLNSAAESRRAG